MANENELGVEESEEASLFVKNADGQEVAVDLLDLSGFDMDDVAEYRAGPMPRGVYEWRAKKPVIDTRLGGNPPVRRAVISMPFECINVVSTKGETPPEQLIGRTMVENFWVVDPVRTFGEIKAFAHDLGIQGSFKLQPLLEEIEGREFRAPVGQRKDKDDKDKVYSHMIRDKGKVEPI